MVKAKQTKKAAVKKTTAKKTTTKKTDVKKVTTKKAVVRKTTALKTTAQKSVVTLKKKTTRKKASTRMGRVPKLSNVKPRIGASIRIRKPKNNDLILVLDFGSQYTQLIARRIREHKVYSKIVPYNITAEEIKELKPKGLILSGGPLSVYDKNAVFPNQEIFDIGLPILGICYGMQVLIHMFGGKVQASKEREFGRAELFIDSNKDLFAGLPANLTCWMSHSDSVKVLPKGFSKIAHTLNASVASFVEPDKQIYGVQFHPEVVHSQRGVQILNNFVFQICDCQAKWTMERFVEASIEKIKETVGTKKVVLGLSGGVDSMVAAVLIHQAIGKRLHCIFVDNGLLRHNEVNAVVKSVKSNFKINLIAVDASTSFVNRLKSVVDPEEKRKIIGDQFVKVFQEKAKRIKSIAFLAQGTLYPDVIESISPFGGPSAMIKSHHNVGGLPKKMKLKLLEPLRELFKDEVRQLGKHLDIPDTLLNRQPFPGPGLAIRIIGEITKERLQILREADQRVLEEIKKAGLYNEIWQSFAVLLPIKTVGVMGDLRTYENVIALRCVTSQDGMTADWYPMPHDLLNKISNRIINEVEGVNRVVYDVSSKPPATIEWE